MGSRPTATANVRPVVSRFGGMVLESHAVHIPEQTSHVSVGAHDNDNDFESRCTPTVANVYAGIPGYTGYKPHGSHPSVLGTDSAPEAHTRATSSLDTSKQPYIMPVVGYKGHIRGLADADKNYGTSHWKNSGAVNAHCRPAASKPWDGRDEAGRPFGGQTPMDRGRYEQDPDYEAKVKDAAERNEILELRSMGIRAMLKAKPSMGGTAEGLTSTPTELH